MIDFNNFKNNFEYYLIPVFFIIGIIGNTFGSLCILSRRKTRERTPLFIQASIGLSDNFLLVSQMQRWLAIFFDHKAFLINNSLCKVYFMILRSSILISAVLTFYLPMIRFISLYMGRFRLSTYSNLGQMCSRLSVVYILSISLSLSWHDLWTSGLKYGEEALLEAELHYDSVLAATTTRLIVHENLKCHKNITSNSIIHVINLVYFCILFFMFSGLIILPLFLCYKINKIKNNYQSRSHRPKSISLSLPLNRPVSSSYEFNRNTFSLGEISGHLLNLIGQKNKVRRKKFTLYVCFVSLISGIFCLPYTILDFSYYNDAQVNIFPNLTNSSMESVYQLNRLPLLLINIPHCIKFYLLFMLYPRFRIYMTNFLKIRFYVDFHMIKKQFNSNSARLNECDKCSNKKIKFVVMNQLNSKKLEKFVVHKSNKHLLKRDFQNFNEFKEENKYIESESDSQSSSIMGYNVITKINKPLLSLSTTGNYIENLDLDAVNLPMVSNPITNKMISSSTFDFIDKSRCLSKSSSLITISK